MRHCRWLAASLLSVAVLVPVSSVKAQNEFDLESRQVREVFDQSIQLVQSAPKALLSPEVRDAAVIQLKSERDHRLKLRQQELEQAEKQGENPARKPTGAAVPDAVRSNGRPPWPKSVPSSQHPENVVVRAMDYEKTVTLTMERTAEIAAAPDRMAAQLKLSGVVKKADPAPPKQVYLHISLEGDAKSVNASFATVAELAYGDKSITLGDFTKDHTINPPMILWGVDNRRSSIHWTGSVDADGLVTALADSRQPMTLRLGKASIPLDQPRRLAMLEFLSHLRP